MEYVLSLEAQYLDFIKLMQDLSTIINKVNYLEITKKDNSKNLQVILKTQNLVME